MRNLSILASFVFMSAVAFADHPPLAGGEASPTPASPTPASPTPASPGLECPAGYEPATSFGRPLAIVQAASAWRRWQDLCRRVDSNPAYQVAGVLLGGLGGPARGVRALRAVRTDLRAAEVAALRGLAGEVPAVCAGAGCASAAARLGMVNVATRVDPVSRVAVAVSHCVGNRNAPGCGTVVVSTAAVLGDVAPQVVTRVERLGVTGGRTLARVSGGDMPSATKALAGDLARAAMSTPQSTGFGRSALTVAAGR